MKQGIIYQISTLHSLINQVYDGNSTIKELKNHGDFGIGTLNGLDGELIMLDGIVFNIKDDGKVRIVNDLEKTPFATVTNFKSDLSFFINEKIDFDELLNIIDTKIETDSFYAIKAEGVFQKITARSAPKQKKPYLSFPEVMKQQVMFDYSNESGTLVGFKIPDYAKGINVQGYHFHYINDILTNGGHVLKFETEKIKICISQITNFNIKLNTI